MGELTELTHYESITKPLPPGQTTVNNGGLATRPTDTPGAQAMEAEGKGTAMGNAEENMGKNMENTHKNTVNHPVYPCNVPNLQLVG